MPNLDGYDLSRVIRREEDPDARIPIVALTANALAGEADRCFEAGMDDYMSKPVTLAELRRVLGRWMTPVRDPLSVTKSSDPRRSARGEVSPIDRALLSDILGGDDLELFEMVSASFRDTAGVLFEDLRRSIAERRGAAVRLAAHKAGGAAGSLAAIPLREALSRVEMSVGEEDWSVIDNLSGEVDSRLQDLMTYLALDG